MFSDKPLIPALAASDVARARDWYRDKLGLEPTRVTDDGGTYYETGGTEFFLYPSEFAGTNKSTAAAWRVDDCAKAVAELRGRGVAFEEYDFGEFKTVDGLMHIPDGSVAAWFKDSEGNILGLFQEA